MGNPEVRRPKSETVAGPEAKSATASSDLSVPMQESGHGGGAGADVELFVDIAQMAADGAVADSEQFGNFLGLQSAGDLLKDLHFAGCELVKFLSGTALLLKALHHQARDLAGHGRAARMGFGDG